MSYYCKGRNCPKSKECIRAMEYVSLLKWHKDVQEGMASGVWYVNEQTCMDNRFGEGVFF